MRKIFLAITLVFTGYSCANRVIQKKYPNCTAYFEFLEKSWEKKDNGFFIIKRVPDPKEAVWEKYEYYSQFQKQWNKYSKDCLCQLTEKEVKAIFGKPTNISSTFKARKKVTTTTYGYHISDENCDENLQSVSRVNICSFIGFTFLQGQQVADITEKPRFKVIE